MGVCCKALSEFLFQPHLNLGTSTTHHVSNFYIEYVLALYSGLSDPLLSPSPHDPQYPGPVVRKFGLNSSFVTSCVSLDRQEGTMCDLTLW